MLDVADGIGMFGNELLYLDVIRYFLRRLAPAGENDLRPECLDLRRRLVGELEVELLACGRTFVLIDRHGFMAIWETGRLAQEYIHDLVFAQRGHRVFGRDHRNYLGRCSR